jgi:hypothetical protein
LSDNLHEERNLSREGLSDKQWAILIKRFVIKAQKALNPVFDFIKEREKNYAEDIIWEAFNLYDWSVGFVEERANWVGWEVRVKRPH